MEKTCSLHPATLPMFQFAIALIYHFTAWRHCQCPELPMLYSTNLPTYPIPQITEFHTPISGGTSHQFPKTANIRFNRNYQAVSGPVTGPIWNPRYGGYPNLLVIVRNSATHCARAFPTFQQSAVAQFIASSS